VPTPARVSAPSSSPAFAYVGVDVAKAHLDVFDPAAARRDARERRVDNAPAAMAALARRLARRGKAAAGGGGGGAPRPCVVVESTGGYERPLLRALVAAGVAAAHVHPLNVRLVARGLGGHAKTDRIDARGLARYGEVAAPMPLDPDEFGRTDELKQLVARRRQLVGQCAATRNQLEHVTSAAVRASAGRTLEHLRDEVAAVEGGIATLIDADAVLKARRDKLVETPGVGQATASVLVAAMPELGRRDRKAIVALAGLAPYDDQSGARDGARHITGGRPDVRAALYMAALVGVRHNPVLRAHYRSLRDGAPGRPALPGKAALVSCMRKLLLHLNAELGRMYRGEKTPERG
jgi:transposase